MPALTAIAIPAADLKGYDDQIAWGKVSHGITDISYSACGFVSHPEGAGQTRLAADDDKVEIASRHCEGPYQGIPSVLQFRFGHVPPFHDIASNIG
jgi:hypothetical protein